MTYLNKIPATFMPPEDILHNYFIKLIFKTIFCTISGLSKQDFRVMSVFPLHQTRKLLHIHA